MDSLPSGKIHFATIILFLRHATAVSTYPVTFLSFFANKSFVKCNFPQFLPLETHPKEKRIVMTLEKCEIIFMTSYLYNFILLIWLKFREIVTTASSPQIVLLTSKEVALIRKKINQFLQHWLNCVIKYRKRTQVLIIFNYNFQSFDWALSNNSFLKKEKWKIW